MKTSAQGSARNVWTDANAPGMFFSLLQLRGNTNKQLLHHEDIWNLMRISDAFILLH